VYIARIGHVSALGLSASSAAEAMLADRKTVSEWVLPDATYPWFTLPLTETDWTARLRRAVGLVGDALTGEGESAPAPAAFAALPLFIGSSSNGAGLVEAGVRAGGLPDVDDIADFSAEVGAALGNRTNPWMFSTACTSGVAALEAAFTLIGCGELDEALVLGVDFGCDTTLAGFASLGLLAREEAADGLILGEAVAGLRLSARPCAGWRIAACRLGVDGYSATAPTPDGQVIAANLAAALNDAQCDARDIDLIKPHRVRLPSMDKAEARALDHLFGARRPPEITFKRHLGHTLGASGPAELTALLAMLDTPAGRARYGRPRRLLLNFIGFGGSVATLIVEACPASGGAA
jgi:3-oxoacyl-[acyl-carrier-protein] synthase-1